MEIGTLIRAFDFNTTDACYMEGKIIDIDTERNLLTVKTTDVVFNGEHQEFGLPLGNEQFKTPMLGYSFTDTKTRFNEDGNESPYQSRIVVIG